MEETTVYVKNLEQWRSVLDIWFNKGYGWVDGDKGYFEYGLKVGNALTLNSNGEILIGREYDSIEYLEFIAQQKEDKKMATVYEVSPSVFDKLQEIKAHEGTSLIEAITFNTQFIKSCEVGTKAILRYLADDPAIDFKVKEQLYRLWAIDQFGDKVYFSIGFTIWGRSATKNMELVFTAPLEEIKKWQTPDWSVEEVE